MRCEVALLIRCWNAKTSSRQGRRKEPRIHADARGQNHFQSAFISVHLRLNSRRDLHVSAIKTVSSSCLVPVAYRLGIPGAEEDAADACDSSHLVTLS